MNKINMFRKLIILLCFIVSTNICLLQLNGQSLLWRISREDIKFSSYLYGTIHIKDKRAFEFNDSVLSAFEKCDAFALEVDLSPENIAQLSQRMILPDDQTLEDLFTAEDYQLIKLVVEDVTGMDILLFSKLKPVAVLSLVMNFQFANDVDMSVDEYFYNKANEQNKKIIGIETMDEQLEILENLPNNYIIDYFKNLDQAKEDLEQIIKLYQSAEIDNLLGLMQKDKSMVMLQKGLLTDRNIKMAERIQEFIDEQTAFIAIGAGHLPGKEGIISLLSRAGYSIEPVK